MKISSQSWAHISLQLDWKSGDGRHCDIRHFEKFNVWRDLDLLPACLQKALWDKPAGHRESCRFDIGELVPDWTESLVIEVADTAFNRTAMAGRVLEPRRGRFYPKTLFDDARLGYAGDMTPVRLVGRDGDRLILDTNHPLAGRELAITVQIHEVYPAGQEHGGRCTDCIRELLDGPGIQVRYKGQATEFIEETTYTRIDERDDRHYYDQPRMVEHLDAVALAQLTAQYETQLSADMRILDLMGSQSSHLPEQVRFPHVTGLGMNMSELEANDRLDLRMVHDLNRHNKLPFEDHSFDAVICSNAVEYLVDPMGIFAEISRVLRPGGVFINSFSNRWFPGKVIALWPELHEFERLGLVASYFQQAGNFTDLHTVSISGLFRNEDDPHIRESFMSDPVYMVWASTRKGI